MAAARLGLRCRCFHRTRIAGIRCRAECDLAAEYADVEALEIVRQRCRVITYEFVRAGSLAMILAARRPYCHQVILETTQDRSSRRFVTLGIGTADYAEVSSAADLRAHRENRLPPC